MEKVGEGAGTSVSVASSLALDHFFAVLKKPATFDLGTGRAFGTAGAGAAGLKSPRTNPPTRAPVVPSDSVNWRS